MMKAVVRFDNPNPHLPGQGKSGTLAWDLEFSPSRELIEVALDRLTGYNFCYRIAADGNSITFWNNIYANDRTIECLKNSFLWFDLVIAED